MDRLGRFLRLPGRDQLLLLQATVLLAAIRVALSTVPFERLRRLLAKLAAPRNAVARQPRPDRAERIIWAVEAVGRHLPPIGTCLTQALAAHVLLARRGRESNLRIGVARHADGKFVAHAWLERDGVTLLGGAWSGNYTPMPALNGLDR